jgi:predicted dehydrogenase
MLGAPATFAVITEQTGDHLGGLLKGLSSSAAASVAMSDPSGTRFAEAEAALGAKLAGRYVSAAEMLAATRPLLTIITMEGHRSPAMVRLALEAGSHVLLEKPGCASLLEFEPLAALAADKGLHLMLAMATRASPAVKQVKALIDAGFLGKPYSATMDWVADQTRLTKHDHLYPEAQGGDLTWKYVNSKAAGGKLIFHGTHYIDALQWLLGDTISSVTAMLSNVGGSAIENEDAAVRYINQSFKRTCRACGASF